MAILDITNKNEKKNYWNFLITSHERVCVYQFGSKNILFIRMYLNTKDPHLPLAESNGFEAANAIITSISNSSIKNDNFIFQLVFFFVCLEIKKYQI